jgi:hypothetical protein
MAEDLESLRSSVNRSLRVEGKADRTLVPYGQSIVYFSRWVAEQDQPADLTSLTRSNALKWLGVTARARPEHRHHPHPLAWPAQVHRLVGGRGNHRH